ncbi:MAG: methyltransferase [Bifidobacteriaceae bacterium]|jgi:16S rRNA (guanine1207-N2)-methyltransferase|nr:methyltransferase [Bifidobacteriaceae bacterium]
MNSRLVEANNHYFSPLPTTSFKQFEIIYTVKKQKFVAKTANGVFSYKRLDLGTRVLLDYIIKHCNLAGKTIFDFGCGWGAISQVLSRFCIDGKFFYTDINQRALQLARDNLSKYFNCYELKSLMTFDIIIANPPIKSGKKVFYQFTQKALEYIKSDGQIIYVIHKNLGADSFLKQFNQIQQIFNATKLSSAKGYRIITLRQF